MTGLGTRSEAFVRTSWDDRRNADDASAAFDGLGLSLESLSADLSLLADQHKSYPILHYYHSEQKKHASAVAVPILDEALTIYRYGVPDDGKPNPMLVEDARSSAQSYLETLDTAFIEPADEVPPDPDLDQLRKAGFRRSQTRSSRRPSRNSMSAAENSSASSAPTPGTGRRSTKRSEQQAVAGAAIVTTETIYTSIADLSGDRVQ